jgi:signal transduction histidine kinase
MSRRLARAIAGSIVLLSLAAVVASIPVGLAARDRIEPGQIVIVGDPSTPRTQEVLAEIERDRAQGDPLEASTGEYNPVFALLILVLFLWLGVGFLIVSRQPTNWAGWLFLFTGAPFPILTLMQAIVVYGLKADPGSVPLVGLWATVGEYALYPIALLPLLFLLYPDGHPPSRRWRRAVFGLAGGTTIAFLGFLFRPGPFNNWIGDGILYENPLGVDGFAEIGPRVITVGTVIALLSALATVVAVRQRFKRSTGEERQRMRWLAFVASLAGIFFVLQWVLGFIAEAFSWSDNAPVFEVLLALTAFTLGLGIPAAYLIAIFRHGLWNLDVVVRKTVQYGVLVVGFTAVVGLVLVLVPIMFLGVSSDVGGVPVIVMGVLLTVGFTLVRSRARRFANRLVYGKRSTPYEVLSDFAERVGGTYSTEDVLPRMAHLLGEATGARAARVWLRIGDRMRQEAAWPKDTLTAPEVPIRENDPPDFGTEQAFEVRHQGELLGALTVAVAADDPMNPTKEKLVRDMAAQAGLVLRNVRLIEELRESRRRIVNAQDEERRRIERNIHDGAQQQLVALSVKLGLAERLVPQDPAKAVSMLEQAKTETGEAIEDLRDLARGIYPPVLADRGLVAALEGQARKSAVGVVVESDGIGRYPQETEAAVYFSCLEALQNVAKYSEATAATVRLAQRNGTLTFTVSDDGRGFDPAAAARGSGLQGISDRLAALGGTFEVRSAPGEGTTVNGSLPVIEERR